MPGKPFGIAWAREERVDGRALAVLLRGLRLLAAYVGVSSS